MVWTQQMLYVKVVTPLVLKRWVWPMIKCSHLTPKSIYSYIDDLVIANCLIDARIGCACFATYFICHLIVWACWCIFYSFKDIHLLFWLFGFFSLCQVDGQECLRTFFSYLWFFSSQTLFMLHHKIWSSQIRTTLCEEHSESPIRHRLKLPKLLCAFRSDRFFHFGHTEITKSI